jgi:hypothetical protein
MRSFHPMGRPPELWRVNLGTSARIVLPYRRITARAEVSFVGLELFL